MSDTVLYDVQDGVATITLNSFGDTLTREAQNMIASGATQDHRDAALAFVEKREPKFTGR